MLKNNCNLHTVISLISSIFCLYFFAFGQESKKDPDYYFNLGFSQFKNGKHELALDNFSKALSIDSAHINAHFLMPLFLIAGRIM